MNAVLDYVLARAGAPRSTYATAHARFEAAAGAVLAMRAYVRLPIPSHEQIARRVVRSVLVDHRAKRLERVVLPQP